MSNETYYESASTQIGNLAGAIKLLLQANKRYLDPAIGVEVEALTRTIGRIREQAWPEAVAQESSR